MDNEIHGAVAPGFDWVREEFAAVVAEENGESGAQLAAFVHGELVVDLWAGPQVTGDTSTGLLSSTKGVSSLVVALLLQEGWLDLDRTVADYWPEFGSAGKTAITLRQVLTNRAGVIGVDGGFTIAELADDRRIAERVATQWPHIRPNSAQAYGGFVTFAIIGEVVRRAAGGSIQGIAYNLHAAGFTPVDVLTLPNDPGVRALGQGSAGGVGSARGLAAIYAAAISGHAPLLQADTLAAVTAVHSTDPDLVRGDRAPYALGCCTTRS
ncbi:serine hydrolase domain-containing protein [Nocardia vinacea]|uniref:serine hydrolase domain-containing protein n=1 Tax=Nocardia vinacea TaxID=96468 RepID=UPI00340930AD